jgi:hypothetical protein
MPEYSTQSIWSQKKYEANYVTCKLQRWVSWSAPLDRTPGSNRTLQGASHHLSRLMSRYLSVLVNDRGFESESNTSADVAMSLRIVIRIIGCLHDVSM